MKLKKEKGITLIALIVTIIVLIILAGVSINLLLGQYGVITKAKEAAEATEVARVKEEVQLKLLDYKMGEMLGNVTTTTLEEIITAAGGEAIKDDEGNITGVKVGDTIIPIDEVIKGVEIGNSTPVANGSWNGTVNTPKIENTGLIPVYWDETKSKWVDLGSESTEEEWNNWYDYADTTAAGAGKSKWANARSADGSMWVWIPRYEYKIDTANTAIDVRFISTDIKSGTEGYTTDSTTGIVKSSDNYIIHPAFMNDTANTYSNGGWSSELPGFWVAKYEAGFQNSTAGEDAKTVKSSPTLKYTTVNESYTTNYLGAITENTTALSYPVFKANTYSYNLISVADAYVLSQEIDTASMYGLSNVDSHMLKNSEWGAVAYLTHSKYGVNGNFASMNEVKINSKNLNDTTNNVYAVTSYGNSDTPNDVNASSTKNMTGVFDLNGGVWERVAGFMQGGAASTPAYHNSMASSDATVSSKYLILYTANNKVGDASNETSGWNSDYSNFVTLNTPVFTRGGRYSDGDSAGVFAFYNSTGSPDIGNGFRACLAF